VVRFLQASQWNGLKKTMRAQNFPAIANIRDFFVRHIFAPGMIACGLGLSVVWISFFGYGIYKLIEFAI
jgi:hypothetical protein